MARMAPKVSGRTTLEFTQRRRLRPNVYPLRPAGRRPTAARTIFPPAQFEQWGRFLAKRLSCYRLSRHAIMYKEDLRTSSTPGLDRPMSASSRSSSSRSCLYWHRRTHPSGIPASHASGAVQNQLRAGKEGEATSRVLVELPQGMFHLRNGAKQRLAAGAHRGGCQKARAMSVPFRALVLNRLEKLKRGRRLMAKRVIFPLI
jgi:hypothetical protein